MNETIKRLEERIEALEQRLANFGDDKETLLVAPVRIVDETGRLIAEISSETNDNALRIFGAQGQAVAALGADGTESGYLAIRNKSGKLAGYLDVERYGARLQLHGNNENGGGLALFGADADETGGGINIIPAENGGGGISLWANKGSGEIRIADSEGNELLIVTDQ